MSDDWIDEAADAAHRLIDLARGDAEFRVRLGKLAARFVASFGASRLSNLPVSPEPPEQSDGRRTVEEAPSRPDAEPSVGLGSNPSEAETVDLADSEQNGRPGPRLELTLGQARPDLLALPPRSSSALHLPGDEEVLERIEAHARLKAEGALWSVRRLQLKGAGADFFEEIAPVDREIKDRAREVGFCRLWMNVPEFEVPARADLMDELSEGFEALADAAALTRSLLEGDESLRPHFERSLDLLAEAQSATRRAAQQVGRIDDPDQFATYNWLRDTTSARHYYIRRHMRADDPADLNNLRALRDQIAEVAKAARSGLRADRSREGVLKRLNYHVKRVKQGSIDPDHQRKKLVEAVDELVAAGVPPSDVEIRDALLPIADDLPEPDDSHRGFALAVRELDRYLASRPPDDESDPEPEPPTAEVAEVARLLRGRNLVMIGGYRRPAAQEALEDALQLGALDWIATREHESIAPFEARVARPEVAAVLLAIRWSSHSFGDVKLFCDAHGKPLVRLPRGYNPNQVAVEILAQCSDRLAED